MEQQLYRVLADFVADQSGLVFDEPLSATLGQRSCAQLYLDSLSFMELAIRLEDEMGIEVNLHLSSIKSSDKAHVLIDLISGVSPST